MTIILYNQTAEANRVDKTSYLGSGVTMSNGVKLADGQSITAPTVLITSNAIPIYNYVYIQDFNRYYFAKPAVWQGNGVWSISCNEDYLMSHKNQILNKRAVASRLQDVKQGMIPDNRYPAETTQLKDTDIIKFRRGSGSVGFFNSDDMNYGNEECIILQMATNTAYRGRVDTVSVKDENDVEYVPSFSKSTFAYDVKVLNGATTLNFAITTNLTSFLSGVSLKVFRRRGSTSVEVESWRLTLQETSFSFTLTKGASGNHGWQSGDIISILTGSFAPDDIYQFILTD